MFTKVLEDAESLDILVKCTEEWCFWRNGDGDGLLDDLGIA